MLPTVDDVLALPEMAAGRPRILAGADALSRQVRWVHVAPVSGTRRLLLGGELLLTTGAGWIADDEGLGSYVDDLVAADAAGLVLELGDRFESAPAALVESCRSHDFPLIVLDREVRFVSITEAVHGRIINSQSQALRERDRVHEVFAELNRRGCTTGFLLDQVARMIRAPVVLEDLNHRALAWSSFDRDPGVFLRGWSTDSRRAAQQASPRPVPYERTTRWESGGWLLTPVEAQGRRWGTLVALTGEAVPSTSEAILENATLTLSLARLSGTDEWTHAGHRALLDGFVEGAYVGLDDVRHAFEAGGFRTTGRTMVALARRGDDRVPELLERVRVSAPGDDVDVVCAPWVQSPEDTALFLFSLDPERDGRADLLVSLVSGPDGPASDHRVDVAMAPETRTFAELPAAADAAVEVVHSLPVRRVPGVHIHHTRDVELSTLLYSRRADPGAQEFVERILGPLLAHDAAQDGDLVAVARAYVEHPTNRKNAAAACHLSRSVFYQRLATIERILGIDLRDGDAVGALQVALVLFGQR